MSAGPGAYATPVTEVTPREQELAARAGSPCPVCGRPVGGTGMCFRSAACVDEGAARVWPDYNPRALNEVRK